MPHAFSLTDGLTTVSLTSGAFQLGAYKLGQVKRDSNGVETQTDTLELTIQASTTAAMQAAYNSVERLLEAARRYQRFKAGPRVFLQETLMNEGATWEAEVLDAELEARDDTLSVWGDATIFVLLHVTRRPFIGPRTELAVSANGQSAATGGRTIDNHTGNWLQVDGAAVAGALPAAVEIRLRNNTGGSKGYRNFHLAVNDFATSLDHIVQGESVQAGWGTVTSDAACSNGQKVIINGISPGNTGLFVWTLSNTLLQATAGRRFRILGRFPSFTDSVVMAGVELRDLNGLVTLAQGEPYERLLMAASFMQDLGAISIPPGGYNNAWADMTLVLRMRNTGSTPADVQLDFLQLTPAERYRHVQQRGLLLENNEEFVDDGINEQVYSEISGRRHPIYAPRQHPITLTPGKTQRIYVLHDTYTGNAPSLSLSARVFYRPRRWSI